MAKPGDTCPKCGQARLQTYCSRQMGESHQVRYVMCPRCDHRSKAIVPAEYVCRRVVPS